MIYLTSGFIPFLVTNPIHEINMITDPKYSGVAWVSSTMFREENKFAVAS